MTIEVGGNLPSGSFAIMTADGPGSLSTDELLKGKRVVLFSVPGAFTPTCSGEHLPGFLVNAQQIKAKGVDTIACLAVNDVFVMDAWGKSKNVADKVVMLADGNGDYTKVLGLTLDATGFGMGLRGQRFSLIADDGVVTHLNVDEGGALDVSSAENTLKQLG